jgi:hypothetical protein
MSLVAFGEACNWNGREVVIEMAKRFDEEEKRIAALGERLGFPPTWAPYRDRKERSGVSQAIAWGDKVAGIANRGDLLDFLQEVAGGIDRMTSKLAEIEAAMAAREASAERRVSDEQAEELMESAARMEKSRLTNAERQKLYRERKKAEGLGDAA